MFTTLVDTIGLMVILAGLSYAIGIWRMVRAPSRVVMLVLFVYMATQKTIILVSQATPGDQWIEHNKSITALPMYILLPLSMSLTYYELRKLHFTPRHAVHPPDITEIERTIEAKRREDDEFTPRKGDTTSSPWENT